MTAISPAADPAGGLSSVPRLLIVEQSWIGHHLYHVRLLIDEASKRGWVPVVALTRAVLDSREYAIHLGASDHDLQTVLIPEEPIEPAALADVARQARASLVVVPDGDRLCMRFGRSVARADRWTLPQVPLSLLVMRDRGQAEGLPGGRVLKTAVKRLLMTRAALRPGLRIAVLRSTTWTGRSVFRNAVDPLTSDADDNDRSAARASLIQVSPDARWVGVFGALTVRKNIPTIARAVLATNDPTIGLAVLGHFDDEVERETGPLFDELRRAGHPVLVENRWLTDAELDAFVGVVDCIALAYSNEGPSGLFGKALGAGTYVLAAGASMLREESRRNRARSSWTRIDALEMAAVLKRLPPRVAPSPLLGDTNSFTRALLDGRRSGG